MKFIKDNWSAILFTLLVHVVVLALFALNIEFERNVSKPAKSVAVQAKIINGEAIDAEVKRQDKLEKDKLDAEIKRQKELEDKALQAKKQREAEEQRLADLERQRQQQEIENKKRKQEQAEKDKQTQLEAKKKADAEKKKLAELEQKRKTEEQRLENIKKQQAETKKKAAEEAKRVAAAEAKKKAELEAKKKAEEERKKKAAELAAKKKKEAEEKRKAEAAEAARLKKEQERLLAEMAGEETFNNAVSSGAMNRYVLAISQTIERNWRKPPGAPENLKCSLNVKQLPGGDVAQLAFGTCNADNVTKDSIEQAVFKASPLPEPEDPSLFTRNLEIIFEPES